ncbi:MAG: metal ABC transporter ATP-binding protein [Rubritalea sp.]|jgi:ABC-type Mn2+/Zn2+ transport system ATPase subunit|tara:strand:- start:7490 stop:8260 length:771 start_codon:yes stop_codon:yes gene_type:complete
MTDYPDHSDHSCCDHHDHHHDIVIKDLTVKYRTLTALKNISFNSSCGNRVALIGPNGGGKSTLLKAIAGLVKKSAGSIQWRGEAIRKWSSEFAYLPQREEVDWNFPITVRGLVEMGRYPQLGMWRKFSPKDTLAVDQALESMDLTGLQNRQIKHLSGGQQQRAFIARAIAQEAHVLLLDEPFTGLDRNAAKTLGDLMHKLAAEGRLIIASHHDLRSAKELFNQVLLINRETVAFGETETLINDELLEATFDTAPDK